eukprot:GEZU01030953.1.p1 GENE.GEZU01030953.1~~GEZU01030953.1.p1  ORF type:complete len:126 (-),score=46.43 GEZU01030953.1:31-408(-)
MNTAKADKQIVVKSIFQKYDHDNSGHISTSEFHSLCYDLGYYLSEDEVAAVLVMLDKNNDKTVSFNEFFEWWKNNDKFRCIDEGKVELLKSAVDMFRKYDVDNSGSIGIVEYSKLCKDLGQVYVG